MTSVVNWQFCRSRIAITSQSQL